VLTGRVLVGKIGTSKTNGGFKMQKEILGVVYHLPKEEVKKAIEYWLQVVYSQGDVLVEKIEPVFDKQYYSIGQFEESYNEVFDGVKVVCKYKDTE